MTDSQMDARLRGAGERWRAATDDEGTAPVDVGELTEVAPARRPARHARLLTAAAAVAAVGLIAGGAFVLRGGNTAHPNPGTENAGLRGGTWLITGLDGNSPSQQSDATFAIDNKGNLVADDECRLVTAHVTQTGDRLTMSDVAVRYKSCIDQYGTGIYEKGTEILRGPATYAIDGNDLTITRAGTGTMSLVRPAVDLPAPSADIPTINDTTWVEGNDTLRIDDSGSLGSLCHGGTAEVGQPLVIDNCPGWNGRWQWTVSASTLDLRNGAGDKHTFSWQPDGPSSIDPAQLAGPTWHLQSVTGQAPAASGATLTFTDNAATSNDGCSTVQRHADVGSGFFSIDTIEVPKSCTGAVADQASTLDSFLTTPKSAWIIRDGKLIVYGGGAQGFAVVYTSSAQPVTLAGSWTLTKILDGSGSFQAVTAPAAFDIAADGSLTGTDGCRNFTGNVQTTGDTANFDVTMPEPACATRVENTAGLVDQVLGGPTTFQLGPNLLVLHREGVGTLTYTSADSSPQDPNLLLAHTWQVATITFGGEHYKNGAPTADPAVLVFSDTGYTLAHTCYDVAGSADRTSDTISFSDGHTTREHSCPAPSSPSLRSESSQAIDAITGTSVRWTIDGDTLTLESNDGTLVLHSIGGSITDLTGSTWRLTGTVNSQTASSAIGDTVLEFPGDGTSLTVTRCFTSGASVDITTTTITVTDLHTTIPLPCPSLPGGQQEQNDFIDSVLHGDVTWAIDGDQLRIANGQNALTFTRRR